MKKFFKRVYENVKRFMQKIFPAYRVTLRIEKEVKMIQNRVTALESKIASLEDRTEIVFWFTLRQGSETLGDVRKRFFLELPPATGELREYQLGSVEIMEWLKEVCTEHGLTYWLEGGTLLGAIRHKGFIPWDDDIDINMLEEDVQKLKELLVDHPKYRFRNMYNYRLCCIIPGIEMRAEGEHGFVDIFPMRFIPSANSDAPDGGRHATKKRINDACAAMRRALIKECQSKNPGVDFVDMDEGNYRQRTAVEKVMKNYMEDFPIIPYSDFCYRSLSALNSPGGADVFPSDRVFPLATAEFEGTEHPVPLNYDYWLTLYYGDYYKLPKDMTRKHFAK